MAKPPQHERGKKEPRRDQQKDPPLVMAAPQDVASARVDRSQVPPGHCFRLYFQGWDQETWSVPARKKSSVVESVASSGTSVTNLLGQLRERQLCTAALQPWPLAVFVFKSRAPFVTGMGIEHPLENGFAFLDPYGLPYLPGSSVKGVIRRAAEELALFDSSSGWTMDAVWWFFGFDAGSGFLTGANDGDRQRWRQAYAAWCLRADAGAISELIRVALPPAPQRPEPRVFLSALGREARLRNSVHLRGSLCFWDVLPDPPRDSRQALCVDLLNPHYAHYYQKNEFPGDWGNPIPIFFLSVPAGTEFRFFIQFRPLAALPEKYREQWRALLERAFLHAVKWLGFGAKTSQGYGRLDRRESEEKTIIQKIEAMQKQRNNRVAEKSQ